MSRSIGPADEFWRLRLVRVDADGEPDLEWRDDVLYRAPVSSTPDERTVWRVEAVEIERDDARLLGAFESEAGARELLDEAQLDLADLSRSQFEDRYLCDSSSDGE